MQKKYLSIPGNTKKGDVKNRCVTFSFFSSFYLSGSIRQICQSSIFTFTTFTLSRCCFLPFCVLSSLAQIDAVTIEIASSPSESEISLSLTCFSAPVIASLTKHHFYGTLTYGPDYIFLHLSRRAAYAVARRRIARNVCDLGKREQQRHELRLSEHT